jgi:aminoglycoside phosphotransferase (APT) family kinase protein
LRVELWVNELVQSFLSGYHAQFSVPGEVVEELAGQATGAEVTSVVRVIGGYDNEVYRVALADDREVFVRIRRPGHPSFDLELMAMDLARDAGVPVPSVLLVTSVPDGERERSAMVLEAAAGRSLAEVLPGLSSGDRGQVLAELGQLLRTLHSVAMPGVWRPDDHGEWPDPSELRRGFIAERRAERHQLVVAGMTPAEVELTMSLLGGSPDTPPLADFVLCHGDATPDHIFVGPDLSVSGLIDWGMWHGGSPIGELAYVASWAYPQPDLTALLTGYGKSHAELEAVGSAIAASLVNQLVGHVAHHVSIGDSDGTANNVRELRRALARVSPS